jgi:hypothetical protein
MKRNQNEKKSPIVTGKETQFGQINDVRVAPTTASMAPKTGNIKKKGRGCLHVVEKCFTLIFGDQLPPASLPASGARR